MGSEVPLTEFFPLGWESPVTEFCPLFIPEFIAVLTPVDGRLSIFNLLLSLEPISDNDFLFCLDVPQAKN